MHQRWKARREVAGIGQRQLPVRPGPAAAAAEGGDEAVGVDVPNAGGAGICATGSSSFGPVGACIGAQALRLLEGEPVGRAPVAPGGRPPATCRSGSAWRRGGGWACPGSGGRGWGSCDLQHWVSGLAQGPRRSAWELPRRAGGGGGQAFSPAGCEAAAGLARTGRVGGPRPGGPLGSQPERRGVARSGASAAGSGLTSPPRVPRRPRGAAGRRLSLEWSRGRRVSLVHRHPRATAGRGGFAEAAGSVPDARCRGPAAPKRCGRDPPRWRDEGDERPAAPPLGPGRGGAGSAPGIIADARMRLRPAGLGSALGGMDCVAVRGARVPDGAVPLVQQRWG